MFYIIMMTRREKLYMNELRKEKIRVLTTYRNKFLIGAIVRRSNIMFRQCDLRSNLLPLFLQPFFHKYSAYLLLGAL